MQTKLLKSADSAYNYPLLIKRLLSSINFSDDDKQIVYRGELRLSYSDFMQRVCKLANTLTNMGVKAGDTVAVLDWDSHRYLECFFAIPMIGAVLHTVNIRLSPEQILYTMNHAEDDVVLINDEFLPIINQLHSQIKTVKSYIRISDNPDSDIDSKVDFVGEYEALLSNESSDYDFPDFDENSIATTFYTSGTTGNPKGVYFSHRQLVLHSLTVLGSMGSNSTEPLMNKETVYMPITPMFHVHAWGVPYVATMIGAQQIYPGRYDPQILAKLLLTEKVNYSHCVPTILQMIVEQAEKNNIQFPGWKVLIGGSALPSGLAKRALDLGIDVYTGYGMSETCPIVTVTQISQKISSLPKEEQVPYRIKAGKPVPLVDLQIWDSQGNPQPHDGQSTGEIVIRTPWLTQSYFKEPEKGNELWDKGWLHTGDLATISEDGFVEICDRIKDVIKTGGEWISSLELESLISSHPAVASVAVVGLPDEQWGERPVALIIPKDDSLDEAAIQQHLTQFVESGRINKWAIPESIQFVEDIPKTSVGKIDKKVIRSQLLEHA